MMMTPLVVILAAISIGTQAVPNDRGGNRPAFTVTTGELTTSTQVIQTRQLGPINPIQLAQAVINILRAFNFTPSPSQILQIFNFVRQLVGIIQQIREQTLPILNAFNQISQALATIFRCERNPSVLDAAVLNILLQLVSPSAALALGPPSFLPPPSALVTTSSPNPGTTGTTSAPEVNNVYSS